jgi:hypothetical protein
MDPNGSSRQPLQSRRKLASPTVTDVRSLSCLLPVWPLISTLVRCAARRGGMGCDNPLDNVRTWHHQRTRRPAQPCQGQQTCARCGAVPVTACHVSGAHIEEKEDPASMKEFLCVSFFSLLLSIILALSWPIKGKAGRPTKGIDSPHHSRTTSIEPRTHS